MSRSNLKAKLFVALVACFSLHNHFTLHAQRATGSILGTVYDRSGAVVPNAPVTVRHTGTGIASNGLTGPEGNFLFSSLPVGTYELTVAANGFKRYVAGNIIVDVDSNQRVTPTLETGALQEVVEVQSQAPLVNTDDASVAQTVNGRLMTDLLLNGRDYQQLQLLSPGAVSLTNFQTNQGMSGGAQNFTNNPTVIVANGGRPGKTEFLIDGSDNYDYRSRTTTYTPSVDAIAEFKHQKSQFSAEYGFGNSAVSVIVKSGSNQVHGTVWEFLRNNAFDARNFFSAGSPDPLRRNQFGANFGGPVWLPKIYNGHGRTFFFVNYEGLRMHTASAGLSTVFTPEMAAGDLSKVANKLYDPATTRLSAPGSTQYVRDIFPGNQIPQNRIDPVAKFFYQFFPAPNRPGQVNNYYHLTPNSDNRNQFIAKVDHQWNASTSISARYSQDLADGKTSGPLYPLLSNAENRQDGVHDSVLSFTRLFGASKVLELRGSYSRITNDILSLMQQGTDYTAQAGIHGFEGISNIFPGVPDLTFTGYTGLAGGVPRPQFAIRNNFAYTAAFSIFKSRHAMKFGANLRWYQQYVTNGGTPRGQFSYTGTYTNNPASPGGTGDGFADYLLGDPFSATRYRPPGWMYPHFPTYGWYFQDDWKVSSRLTVNLGLRYELYMPFKNKYDQFSTFMGSLRNGKGGIVVPTEEALLHPTMDAVPLAVPFFKDLLFTADQAGISRNLRATDWNNIAPRVGFAFRPGHSDDFVIRGGYGIYYLPFDGGRQTEWFTVPFIVRETSLSNTTPIPTRTTANFYPPGSAFDPRATITAEELNSRIGYLQQWSFGIQRRLPYNMVVETYYVGSKGTKLERIRPINDPLPGPGDVEARRPYPDFRGISYREDSASSMYHALQVKVERRWSSGLQLLASYTNSKLMDDTGGDADAVLDPRNAHLMRAVSDYDIAQRFTASPVYELPFFARSGSALARNALSGWTFAGIVTLQSGLPFTPIWNGSQANTGVSAIRPNRIGSGELSNPTVSRWFDVSAFVAPQQYTFGNSGRNILRMDGISNCDLALYKTFRLRESVRMQFRAEFFNTLNHPDFGAPVATVNAPGAGTVNTASAPRIMQFALKIYY